MKCLTATLLFALSAWCASLEKVSLQNFAYWEESNVPFPGQNDSETRYVLRGSLSFLRLTGNTLRAQSEFGNVIGIRFSDNATASRGADQAAMRVHRFEGPPEQWRRDIPSWNTVAYSNAYPFTDVEFRPDTGTSELRMRVVLRPGGNPQSFALQGSDNGAPLALLIEAGTGQWTASAGFLLLRFSAPVAWQEIAGRRTPVTVRMISRPSGALGFEVGTYDTAQALQIETALSDALTRPEFGSVLRSDPQGNFYAAGSIRVAEACGINTGGGIIRCNDAWLAKFNANGEAIYQMTMSGRAEDVVQDLQWRAPGELVIVGNTGSNNFPVTPDALQKANAGPLGPRNRNFLGLGGDLFLARLDANSGDLLYSSFFGNAATGESGTLALTGESALVLLLNPSADLPVSPNAWQRLRPCEASARCANFAFLRLDRTLTQLEAASFLPVADFSAFVVHPDQSVTLLGTTIEGNSSLLAATPGALQEQKGGGSDAYLLRLKPDLSSPVFATFYGGPKNDIGQSLALDAEANYLVAGYSRDSDSDPGENFLIQVSADGSKLLRSLPATAPRLNQLLLLPLPDGRVLVTGSTSSATAPTSADAPLRAGCANTGQFMGFVSVLGPDGAAAFASYLPVQQIEISTRRAVLDGQGQLIVFDNSTGSLQRLNFAARSNPLLACVTGAASRRLGSASALQGISPGQIVTLVGAGMGPDIGQAASLSAAGRLPLNLAGVSLRFNGIAAPLLYVQASQINAVVPYEGIVPREQALVELEYNGQKLSSSVLTAFTGVELFTTDFSGDGQAVAVNEDGSLNSSSNPARRGSIVVVYGTGIGTTQPASISGALTPLVPPAQLPKPIGGVIASLDGRIAEPLYAGAAPGLISGAAQFNLRIPADLPIPTDGLVRIDIRINGSLPGNNPWIAIR